MDERFLTKKAAEALQSVGCQDVDNFWAFFRNYGVSVKAEHEWYTPGRRASYMWMAWSDHKTELLDEGKIPGKDDEGKDNQAKAFEFAILTACAYVRVHPEKYEPIEEVESEATPYADYIRTSYEYRNDGNLTGLEDY